MLIRSQVRGGGSVFTEKYRRSERDERQASVALAQSPEGRGFDLLSQGAGHREGVRPWGAGEHQLSVKMPAVTRRPHNVPHLSSVDKCSALLL